MSDIDVDALALVHPAHERVLEEGRELSLRLGAKLHVQQFCPPSREAAGELGNGGRRY